MKQAKQFIVTVSMKWTVEVPVKAKTASEARRKAWAKFKLKRKDVDLEAEEA